MCIGGQLEYLHSQVIQVFLLSNYLDVSFRFKNPSEDITFSESIMLKFFNYRRFQIGHLIRAIINECIKQADNLGDFRGKRSSLEIVVDGGIGGWWIQFVL